MFVSVVVDWEMGFDTPGNDGGEEAYIFQYSARVK